MINRTAAKAALLVRRHAGLADACGVALSGGGLAEAGEAHDVVLNSSASSLGGAAVPVPDRVLTPGTLAVDLMYGAAARRFMAWAQSLGALPRDGLGMLVEQAAEAFFLWRGVMPDTAPVLRPAAPTPWTLLPTGHEGGSPAAGAGAAVPAGAAAELHAAHRRDGLHRSAEHQLPAQRGLAAAGRAAARSRGAGQWVPYAQISPHLKRAVIASEDAGFAEHSGVEWDAIEQAWEKNQRAEAQAERAPARAPARPVSAKVVGGSTITQQLAKNLFLSGERTVLRKAQELMLALMLETMLSKQRILEIYLNHVEWGEGVFGAQAAARHYFRKDASRLGPEEAARLAVMLPAPKRFEKRPGSAYVSARAATIVARMGAVQPP